MKARHTIWGALAASLLALVACTSMPATVKYDEFKFYVNNPAPAVKYRVIGPVSAKEEGYLWTSCHEVSQWIAGDLNRQAHALGGDAVIEVRWRDGDIAPSCRRNYWLFGIYPFFAPWWFMPWGTVSNATGLAVKVE